MLLHEFYGQGDYQDRKALVIRENDAYIVIMMADKTIYEERKITGHSEVYAENCAENWVLGVI
tara:strand:+ start:171 stop:359 length:189 start_codon:yes stop_codon:yes gene_type:complete